MAVYFSECDGNFESSLHCFIYTHEALLLSLGTVFLISGLAFLTAFIAKQSAERRDTFNRQVQATLQIAQFRQAWINSMHSDLSELYELLLPEGSGDSRREMKIGKLVFAITVRLNLENGPANSLFDLLQELFEARSQAEKTRENIALGKLPRTTNAFLKSEWEELKLELKKAQSSSLIDSMVTKT